MSNCLINSTMGGLFVTAKFLYLYLSLICTFPFPMGIHWPYHPILPFPNGKSTNRIHGIWNVFLEAWISIITMLSEVFLHHLQKKYNKIEPTVIFWKHYVEVDASMVLCIKDFCSLKSSCRSITHLAQQSVPLGSQSDFLHCIFNLALHLVRICFIPLGLPGKVGWSVGKIMDCTTIFPNPLINHPSWSLGLGPAGLKFMSQVNNASGA